MYRSGHDVWGPELLARRPDVTMATVEAYLHALYRARADFVYSVSREFVRGCQTPMLVLPDATPNASVVSSVGGCGGVGAAGGGDDGVSLTGWPAELKARTIEQVREFLRAHRPVTAAAAQ